MILDIIQKSGEVLIFPAFRIAHYFVLEDGEIDIHDMNIVENGVEAIESLFWLMLKPFDQLHQHVIFFRYIQRRLVDILAQTLTFQGQKLTMIGNRFKVFQSITSGVFLQLYRIELTPQFHKSQTVCTTYTTNQEFTAEFMQCNEFKHIRYFSHRLNICPRHAELSGV